MFPFSKLRPTKGFVPDIVGLLELFFSIPTGCSQFYEISTENFDEILTKLEKARFEL